MLTMGYNSKSMAEKRENVKRELRRHASYYHLGIYFKDASDFNHIIAACLVKNSTYVSEGSYQEIMIDLLRFDGDDYSYSCIKDIMKELSDIDNFSVITTNNPYDPRRRFVDDNAYNQIVRYVKDGLNVTYGMYGQYKPAFLAQIENVIFNDPATIVFWSDDTKTVVKAQDGEEFDPEKGLVMAIAKKKFGNNGNYYNHIKKWVEPYYKKNEIEE